MHGGCIADDTDDFNLTMSCLRSQMVGADSDAAAPADGAELVLDNPLAELRPGDLLTIRFAGGGAAHGAVARDLSVRLATGTSPPTPYGLLPLGGFRYRMIARPDPAAGVGG